MTMIDVSGKTGNTNTEHRVRKKGLFVKCSLKVARNKSVIRGEGSNNMLGLGGMR